MNRCLLILSLLLLRGELCANNVWSGPNCLSLEGMARARRYIRHRELSLPRWRDATNPPPALPDPWHLASR